MADDQIGEEHADEATGLWSRLRETLAQVRGHHLVTALREVLSIVFPWDCSAFRFLFSLYTLGWLATTLWPPMMSLAVTAESIRDPLRWHTLLSHFLVLVGLGNWMVICIHSGIPIRFLSARVSQRLIVWIGLIGAISGAGVYSTFASGPLLVSSGMIGWSLSGAVMGSLVVSRNPTSIVEIVYVGVIVTIGVVAAPLSKTVLTWAMLVATLVGVVLGAGYSLRAALRRARYEIPEAESESEE